MAPLPPPPPEPRAWSATRRHPRLRFSRATLARCLQVLEAQPGPRPPAGEISLAFLTDAALAQLHDEFLDDPAPTDVITFPGEAADGFAGEIGVSVDRAITEARQRRHPFALELTLYLVHGWLHLAGLDDLTARGRRDMRQGERRLLAALRRARALPDFHLAARKKTMV
ncbi:MAG TPA: rRNA maturation RNase YbeY [Opitutales bacterium]|nr:rRNA maturation RNase YbeY [Opitutales bacterium]